MILLLGGTSETEAVALGLANTGYEVLVSTATDIPLEVGTHPRIQRRSGKLDSPAMVNLIKQSGIKAIVDVTHPYAAEVRETARQTAAHMNLPYLTLIRPTSIYIAMGILLAQDHKEAAQVACSFGCPVLLTIGSKNLHPYACQSRIAGVTLIARVLNHAQSIKACCDAGIPERFIITGRGPFPVEENRVVIRRFGIGVLVTKDSGLAGGVPEKLKAAQLENCKVVVVSRPVQPDSYTFEEISELIGAVSLKLPKDKI